MEKEKIKQALIQKLLGIMGGEFASKDQLNSINEKFEDILKQYDLNTKFDVLVSELSKKWEAQYVKNVTVDVPANIVFEGLTKELEATLLEVKTAIEANKLPEILKVVFGEKPEWYKDAPESVSIKKMPAVTINNVVKTKADMTESTMLLAEFFKNLVDFFSRLATNTFKVMLNKEHYYTPQYMLLLDPMTMKPLNPKDIGIGSFNQFVSQGVASGPRNVGVRGANTINDGTTTVTTAGTRVQLPSVQCSRVYIQSAPGNTGDVVVGGENVIASAGTRRGLALFSSQWQAFEVDNLNRLYIDSTADGDKINYIYEYFA